MARLPQTRDSQTTSVQEPADTVTTPEPDDIDREPLKRIGTPRSSGYSVTSLQKTPVQGEEATTPAGDAEGKQQQDSDIVVGWDGPDDPENPRTWTQKRKWVVALTVSSFTFISPIASSMVAPAASQIAQSFNIRHSFEANLTIAIFVLAYAFGPLILGPLSENFGRAKVLQAANMFFLVWNLACGFAQTEPEILIFRFLSGFGGSAPLACGGAVLGDLWAPEERGKAIAVYSLAPLLGPAIGPVAGGWIAERSTWRWVFWSTSIAAGVIQVFAFFALPETYAPVLLRRKAKKIRKQMDEEKELVRVVRTMLEKPGETTSFNMEFVVASLFRPFVLFAKEPIIQLISIYLAFIYGVIYMVITIIPPIYTNIYHENPGHVGLHYIALGLGLFITSQINARALDRVYIALKKRNNDKGEPEFRLPTVMPGTLLIPAGLLICGWGAQAHTHWIVPDIGFFCIGSGMILIFQGMTSYVIDSFTMYAASALAAVSFFRSLAGFGFPLFAPAMFAALGYGKGNTILAAFAMAVGCPAMWVFWRYGKKIRNMSTHARKQ